MNDGSRNETRIPFVYGGVVQIQKSLYTVEEYPILAIAPIKGLFKTPHKNG